MNPYNFKPHVDVICDFEPSDDLSQHENEKLSKLCVAIINVKRSTKRREKMVEKISKLKMNTFFFNAYDGAELIIHKTHDPFLHIIEHKKNYFLLDYTRHFDHSMRGNLSVGMVGASLSHIMLYNSLQSFNCDGLLILEDDATLSQEPSVIRKYLANLPEGFDMAFLNSESKWWPIERVGKVNDFYSNIKRKHFNASVSYAISVRGAGKLLAYIRNDVTRPPDDLCSNAYFINVYTVIASNEFLFGCDYSFESDTARFSIKTDTPDSTTV